MKPPAKKRKLNDSASSGSTSPAGLPGPTARRCSLPRRCKAKPELQIVVQRPEAEIEIEMGDDRDVAIATREEPERAKQRTDPASWTYFQDSSDENLSVYYTVNLHRFSASAIPKDIAVLICTYALEFRPQVGALIDVLDERRRWAVARVLEIRHVTSKQLGRLHAREAGIREMKVQTLFKVHFIGWHVRWDKLVRIDDCAPLFSNSISLMPKALLSMRPSTEAGLCFADLESLGFTKPQVLFILDWFQLGEGTVPAMNIMIAWKLGHFEKFSPEIKALIEESQKSR